MIRKYNTSVNIILIAIIFIGQTFIIYAQDETINGNLSIEGNLNIKSNNITSNGFSSGVQNIGLRGMSGQLSYINLSDGTGYPWNFGFGLRTSDIGKGIYFSVGNITPQLIISSSGVRSSVNLRLNNLVGDSYPNNSFFDLDDDQTTGSNMLSIGGVSAINYLADTNNNNNTGSLHRWYKGSPDIDNATLLMSLGSNGRLGIGTFNPARKIESLGAIRSTRSNNSNQYIELETGESNYARLKANSASNNQKGLTIQNIVGDNSNPINANNYIDFRNGYGSGDLRYRIDYLGNHNFQNGDITTNGDVGIGTRTTGNHKLAVEGSIGAREVKVETTNWSDFVFFKDYKLPKLEEVEKHIKEKGHLQDIPSAKEVKNNGIFLGEMNAKLLQKIEELMLYTISQEKKLKYQESELLNLTKQNKILEKCLMKLQKRLSKLERQ